MDDFLIAMWMIAVILIHISNVDDFLFGCEVRLVRSPSCKVEIVDLKHSYTKTSDYKAHVHKTGDKTNKSLIYRFQSYHELR